jgi:hypothetical protein
LRLRSPANALPLSSGGSSVPAINPRWLTRPSDRGMIRRVEEGRLNGYEPEAWFEFGVGIIGAAAACICKCGRVTDFRAGCLPFAALSAVLCGDRVASRLTQLCPVET